MRRIALCLFLLVGCDDRPSGGTVGTSKIGAFEIPLVGRPRLDLLFVVDNSSEMTQYQAQLVMNYSKFADTLAAVPGGTPDLNVGVSTGDPSTGGTPRTATSVSGPVLIDGMRDGVRIQNYTGTLGAAMTELLDAGTAGTSQHVLDAIPLALDQNPMLARDNAYLGVVLIAASDDASTVDVGALAAELKARRSDPTNLVVIGVYARPAPRLDAFLAQFPYRNAYTAIDASDPSAGLRDLTYFRTSLGSPCLEWAPFDVDPEMAGTQYECSVVETVAERGAETLLPQCGSEQPCWDFVPDPINCLTGEHLALRIERGVVGNPYEATIVKGQCLIE